MTLFDEVAGSSSVEIDLLRAENAQLREEVRRLRGEGARPYVARAPQQLSLDSLTPAKAITNASPNIEKVQLFRRLFRGREDVYAMRWERPDGQAGYAPAVTDRWTRESRNFLPVTDQTVEQHLTGRHTIGIYPLLLDERCWFLAVDFDKAQWQQDALAYLDACDAIGVPASLERSRSGNGAHVWIFFESAVLASQARDLGSALLTAALAQRRQLGLDSYDRLFPSQNTVPKGGFGNLIALPMQAGPRRQGNSLFVDRNLKAYPDQWAFLSAQARMTLIEVHQLIADARKQSAVVGVRPAFLDDAADDDPWTLLASGKRSETPLPGPFPRTVTVTLGNQMYIPKDSLSEALLSRLWRLAAFENPDFHRTQALKFSTYGKPRIISCAEEFSRHIALPRGCLDDVRAVLEEHGVQMVLADERQSGQPLHLQFGGLLTPEQQQAADVVIEHDDGVLCAPTGFGKTVVAAAIIATRGVNSLILVHRRQLLDQWRERLAAFLNLPLASVGQIGAGRNKPTGILDVAVMQSLSRAGSVPDLARDYGQVIVDECHHVPAASFERILRHVNPRFVLA